MINFIRNFYRVIYILRRAIFYKLLSDNEFYNPDFKIKILLFLISPINFFKKPNQDFGKSLRLFITETGPIFIKFGQMLSTRPDLVGESIAKELTILQDKLSSFEYDQTKLIFEKDFNIDPEFWFDEISKTPIAAASVAQVYKWKTKKDVWVAVKVLRPNIKERYLRDLELFYFLSKLVKKFSLFKNLNPIKLVEIFEKMMKRELNMKIEASTAEELRDNLKNDDVIIPKIYFDHVSENILVMEWIDGISIYETEKLFELNFDLEIIAQKIAIMFFNQAFIDGFFHSDLHHGNIIITKSGKICLLDFGIVSRLKEEERIFVAEMLFCFLKRDYRRITELHIINKIIPKNIDEDLFTSHCRIIGESIIGIPLSKISLAKLLGDLLKMVKEFEVTTQPQFFFLQKTMLTVEGIGQSLHKESNMWKLIEPWIKKWAMRNITPEAKIYRYLKNLLTLR